MATYSGTPRTWATSEVITAALLNSDVRDPLAALAGAWNSYTPTLTGFALGNGTVSGAYIRVGKLVAFRALLTFGSLTTAPSSTAGQFSLPVTGVASNGLVVGRFNDTGTTVYSAFAYLTTTQAVLYAPGTNGAAVNLSSTVPFTWAATDLVSVAGLYEAA